MRRALRILVVAVAAVGILLLFVLPGRTFLAQQRSLAATQRQAAELATENSNLKAEAKQLQSTGEIEQIARADYGLILPGEQAYTIIPARTAPTTVPPPTTTTTLPPPRSSVQSH